MLLLLDCVVLVNIVDLLLVVELPCWDCFMLGGAGAAGGMG